ncbi:MAG: caspase family protein [Cytophagaceae bacterium]|nr:caspase family protein [Cytophagaceae bacterium]
MCLLWLSLNLLLACQPLKQSGGNTYAVVVGVGDYQWSTAQTGDLPNADADAKRVVAFLQTDKGGRVPTPHIRLLLDRAATRRSILNALTLFEQAQPQDRILFFFSGHGAEEGFVPYEMKNSGTSCVSYDDVKAAFRASAAQTKLCIADACLSGRMRQADTKTTAPTGWRESSKTGSQANTVMILSSRNNQVSYESGALGGGVFTHFLLNGLNGKADANRNRTVTIRELYDYMAPRVRANTANGQRAVMFGHFTDDLPVSTW